MRSGKKGWAWILAWMLGTAFFAALMVFYAGSIAVRMHQRDVALFRASPANASLLMRVGQYKPALLKPPFNAFLLLGFPLVTLLGAGLLARVGLRRSGGED